MYSLRLLISAVVIVTLVTQLWPTRAAVANERAVLADETRAMLVLLVDRLDGADQTMHELKRVQSVEDGHAMATTVLDLLTGPTGRHAGATTLAPGVFPGDVAASNEDPGLALAIYDAVEQEDVRRQISDVILGDVGSWRSPAARWDEIDAVVAAWRPDENTLPSLDGHLMRVVGWSLLTLRSNSATDVRSYARHGVIHTGLSLMAARRALAAFDVEHPEMAVTRERGSAVWRHF